MTRGQVDEPIYCSKASVMSEGESIQAQPSFRLGHFRAGFEGGDKRPIVVTFDLYGRSQDNPHPGGARRLVPRTTKDDETTALVLPAAEVTGEVTS